MTSKDDPFSMEEEEEEEQEKEKFTPVKCDRCVELIESEDDDVIYYSKHYHRKCKREVQAEKKRREEEIVKAESKGLDNLKTKIELIEKEVKQLHMEIINETIKDVETLKTKVDTIMGFAGKETKTAPKIKTPTELLSEFIEKIGFTADMTNEQMLKGINKARNTKNFDKLSREALKLFPRLIKDVRNFERYYYYAKK